MRRRRSRRLMSGVSDSTQDKMHPWPNSLISPGRFSANSLSFAARAAAVMESP